MYLVIEHKHQSFEQLGTNSRDIGSRKSEASSSCRGKHNHFDPVEKICVVNRAQSLPSCQVLSRSATILLSEPLLSHLLVDLQPLLQESPILEGLKLARLLKYRTILPQTNDSLVQKVARNVSPVPTASTKLGLSTPVTTIISLGPEKRGGESCFGTAVVIQLYYYRGIFFIASSVLPSRQTKLSKQGLEGSK